MGPKVNYSNLIQDKALWSQRSIYSAYRDGTPSVYDQSNLVQARQEYFRKKYEEFNLSFKAVPQRAYKRSVDELVKQLNLLSPQKLLPSSFHQKGSRVTLSKNCICTKSNYGVPMNANIPPVLLSCAYEPNRFVIV